MCVCLFVCFSRSFSNQIALKSNRHCRVGLKPVSREAGTVCVCFQNGDD